VNPVNPVTATSSAGSNTRSVNLVGPEPTVRLVTTIVGIVVGPTFLFGFVCHEALCFEWRWKTFTFGLSQQVDCS
jgi:hypothetical protein